MTAPMVIEEGVMPTSCLEHFATALGRMTGGMISDGPLDMGSDSTTLLCIQSILTEAGVDNFLLGATPDESQRSSFLSLTDGSIWRLTLSVLDGNLVADAHECAAEEVTSECPVLQKYHDLIRAAVSRRLNQLGWVMNGDTCSGHIETQANAAICMRASGFGKFIVNVGETGTVRCGFDFTVDCPRPNASFDDVVASVNITPMMDHEIEEESERNKAAMGITSPFPVKMGSA